MADKQPELWKQERPLWCLHQDCQFLRRTMDAMCGGELVRPSEHEGQLNTHRFCIRCPDVENGPFMIHDYQVNDNDLQWFRWIFDALDGKKTSWLSSLLENVKSVGLKQRPRYRRGK